MTKFPPHLGNAHLLPCSSSCVTGACCSSRNVTAYLSTGISSVPSSAGSISSLDCCSRSSTSRSCHGMLSSNSASSSFCSARAKPRLLQPEYHSRPLPLPVPVPRGHCLAQFQWSAGPPLCNSLPAHLPLPPRLSTRVLSRQLQRVSGVRKRQQLRSSSSTTLVISRTSRATTPELSLLLRLQSGTACRVRSSSSLTPFRKSLFTRSYVG